MNRGGGVGGGSASAPTGCYKCGRPGHWSRDCPSSNPNNNNSNSNSNPPPLHLPRPPLPPQKQKQKTQRRSRPKLTPDILLSDRGIGHILRYFPRALKCRGRGREFNDLQHLLGLYAEWHSRLLPYYNFDQFIHKVEQVGATKRVKDRVTGKMIGLAKERDGLYILDTKSGTNNQQPTTFLVFHGQKYKFYH